MNICQHCGHINPDDTIKCENCENEIDSTKIERIVPFAKDAVYYGYLYRLTYEEQVKEHGEVKIKFSLLAPSNYFELLAVFALSGYIGGLSFQLVNFIGKKILEFIKTKINKEKEDEEFENFIIDEEKVKIFVQYVNDYYNRNYLNNQTIAYAILEEEMADLAAEQKKEVVAEMIKNVSANNQDELLKQFKEIGKGVADKRRKNKPQDSDLKDLFTDTKKGFIVEKKKKQRKNKKKKK